MGLSTQNAAYYGAWPNDLMARTTVLCAVDESRHVCDERHSAVCSRCPGLQCGCSLIAAHQVDWDERERILASMFDDVFRAKMTRFNGVKALPQLA